MLVVDDLRPVELRDPVRPAVLVPYLLLFLCSILLVALLGSMVVAVRQAAA